MQLVGGGAELGVLLLGQHLLYAQLPLQFRLLLVEVLRDELQLRRRLLQWKSLKQREV